MQSVGSERSERQPHAEHLRYSEREVAVRNGKKDRFRQQGNEKLNLFLVAGWAEPAPLTGEGQQVLVLAVVTPDSGKPVLQVTAIEEFIHHLGNDRAQETVAGVVALLVILEKHVEMPGQALPERRGLWLAGTIDLIHHAAQCRQEGVSSNDTPPKKV